jgi:hypothetical protein
MANRRIVTKAEIDARAAKAGLADFEIVDAGTNEIDDPDDWIELTLWTSESYVTIESRFGIAHRDTFGHNPNRRRSDGATDEEYRAMSAEFGIPVDELKTLLSGESRQ